jgi:AraC family transcriptional regulator, regulatory protein of adaptative response / DNA-3-methyladenine glycosylase II
MDAVIDPGLQLDRAALDRARLSRDPRFDGRFYIAVLSTRIYCRPICPAPSPKPDNIRYYATAAAAAEAGFRPCLRCRPEAAPASPAWLGVSAVVRRALRLIDEGALDEGSVSDLATRLGIGERHLRRLFDTHVGASPMTVAQTRRLHFAKRLIDATNLSMTEVALAAGYGSVRRFNAAFRASYGRPPSELRRRRRAGAVGRGDGILLRLAYRPPYGWRTLLEFLAARAADGLERVGGGEYARTVLLDGNAARLVVRSPHDVAAIECEVHGAPPGALFNAVNRVRRMFDLAVEPSRVECAFRDDPRLAPLVRRCPGLRIPGVWDGFECAVRCLVSDGSAARERRLVSRLVAACGRPLPATLAGSPGLTHLFPEPSALAAADLSGHGFSATQAAALKTLACAVRDGEVDFTAAAEEVMRALLQLPGSSERMAEEVALRGLGEPDAFPVDAGRLSPAAGRPALAEAAESWRPWRGYAALYLRLAGQERTQDAPPAYSVAAAS